MTARWGAAAQPAGRAARTGRVLLRSVIGALLLATGIAKLLDVRGFAAVLGTYRAFEESLLLPMAILVPVSEVLLGAWLFSGRRPFSAAVAALAMHLGYAGWAAAALLRGIEVANCGCFGVFFARRLGWSTVIEDLVVAAICGGLVAMTPRGAREETA